ncbi:MAG: UvrD-helicase domain-containing protein, partial [Planctomycetes bacterium]|nr:UvrD-helicase domain-containing protein [Planctomycetota bacterium]
MTSDAGARRDAVTRTDENVVLRASAGTGKTTVLVERLACLILRDGVDPEHIVSITFTEMAAAEMKTRLRRRLMDAFKWAQGEDPKKAFDEAVVAAGQEKVADRAQSALERLDRAAIETMHAFAARLLRTFPEEAGVDPSFSIEDHTAAQEGLDRDWAAWSREEFAAGSPRLDRWRPVLRALPWANVQTLAFRLADWEDIPQDPGAIPEEAQGWHGALLANVEDLASRAEAKSKRVTGVMEQARAAAEVLRKAKTGGWRPLDLEDDRFEGAFSDSYVSTGWTKEEWTGARSAYDAAKAWAATRTEAVEAVRLLAGFAEFHRENCLRAGRLSFNALLFLARDLLRRRPQSSRRFEKHRFLVDEFQDTDARQAEIVLRLASPPREPGTDWRTLKPRPGAIFVVGDGKQSIYAWRSADLGVYDAVNEQLIAAGALPRELADNFRSQPAVIDAANRIFGEAFAAEAGIQAPPADLVAARESKSLSGRVVTIRSTPVPEGTKAPGLARAEARSIANWISESRGKLRIEVEDGDATVTKPMRFRDIAILLRAGNYLPEYLQALRAAKIPYVVTREQHFYEAQEVRDAINLLGALVRPDDALALAGVMRSPVGGLTFDDISAAGRPDFRRNAPGRTGDLFSKLRDLRSRALRLPVPEAVDLILADSGLRAAAAASAHGEQALANLDKVASLAARWAAPDLTLAAFADRLGRRVLDVEREAESPLGEPDDEVVRVSTIH